VRSSRFQCQFTEAAGKKITEVKREFCDKTYFVKFERRVCVFNQLREDIRSIRERDPAARSKFEVLLLYSGLHAIIYYRISHWLYTHKRYILARWLSQHAKFRTGIEIHPAAKIGKGLFIDHGTGVVIGETAEIGDNCTIYQGVTLGGTGKDKGKRHPTLGNNVMVGAGAKILGPFKVGDNAKIGSNALVLSEVPANGTAVGVPARVVRVNGKKVSKISDLDQIHMPDPVSQEFCRLVKQIDDIQKEVETLTQK
jgi:serine O-acetyltransferase